VTANITLHDGIIYIVVIMKAQNTGQVNVRLSPEYSGLDVRTTKTGDDGWTYRYSDDVFLNHTVVQPGETLEDQAWLEIPYDNEVGIKLDLTVAMSATRSYPTTELIQLLPSEGGRLAQDG
jgi:hypothetical protein